MKHTFVLVALSIFVGLQSALAKDEVKLIVVPRVVTLSGGGYVLFDVYLLNGAQKRVELPAPESRFTVEWKLRDVDNVRSDRNGSDRVIGTDTVKKYVITPQSAIKCELGFSFLAEEGDILEFYVTIPSTIKAGETHTIRSNSVMMYRSKDRGAKER